MSHSHVNFVVDGELISSIKEGLCVLVGIGVNDTKKDIEYLSVLFVSTIVTYPILHCMPVDKFLRGFHFTSLFHQVKLCM